MVTNPLARSAQRAVEISFITKTTGAILQLACSMDYAIFLVDRFEEIRREGYEAIDAMSIAVSKSAARRSA